ncbi:MAG: rod shape-determining protein MreD [Bacteroidaceae bacterium]|nr:rod shape-determining protein MreD [Bacteroidaceae bacterium]
MNSTTLFRALRFIILLSFQILVLNHVHLMSYITPLIIGYMVISLHRGTSRISCILWGFSIGLIFDIFSDTAGMASAACTLVGLLQPVILGMFTPRDAAEDFVPTVANMGFWNYTLYSFILMIILHAVFYILDAFTLSNIILTLSAIIGGTIFATILVLFCDLLVRARK